MKQATSDVRRITVELPRDLHRRVVMAALDQNVPMRRLLTELVASTFPDASDGARDAKKPSA